ncbi:twin-arginine translocation signal domain-containing protein [Algihabitans albus]|uniref:twin-arginine translocation signal domain-containing protein n=1 Tax=Algihabitans albus TaxID=2164067 RepID=UPI0035D01E7E
MEAIMLTRRDFLGLGAAAAVVAAMVVTLDRSAEAGVPRGPENPESQKARQAHTHRVGRRFRRRRFARSRFRHPHFGGYRFRNRRFRHRGFRRRGFYRPGLGLRFRGGSRLKLH